MNRRPGAFERDESMDEPSEAFRAMIIEHLPRLRRFTRALTGNVADADDLAQSAVERALVKHRSFAPGSRFDAWMFRIARNLWIDGLRRAKVRGPTVDIDDAGWVAGSDGREVAETHIAAQKAVAAMTALPEAQRDVAALVLVEGLSYQEAADALEIPIGTVMSRLSRARKSLADALETPRAAQAGES
jgi:RNA polymerase sigma-70 factor (ECF subfamily)